MHRIETKLKRNALSERPDLLTTWIDTEYMQQQRWFLRKSNKIKDLRLRDSWILKKSKKINIICTLMDVEYFDSQYKDTYYLPLMLDFDCKSIDKAIAEIRGTGFLANLYDCSTSLEYYRILMDYLRANATLKSRNGHVRFQTVGKYEPYRIENVSEFQGEQSNTVMFIGEKDVIKTFRKLQPGINPDLEVHLKLSSWPNVPIPKLDGYLSYKGVDSNEYAIAMIEKYVPNDGDAWEYVLKNLDRLFDYANANFDQREIVKLVSSHSIPFRKEIAKLGEVIAELHFELSQAFGCDDIDKDDLNEWQHSMLGNIERAIAQRVNLPNWFLDSKNQIIEQSQKLFNIKDPGLKIRIHGDLHLGQILKTSDSFCVIDFEGEPLKSYDEVRKKNSVLRDVAGMLRSFNYAATVMAIEKKAKIDAGEKGIATDYLSNLAKCWEESICDTFVEEYIRHTNCKGVNYLPKDTLSLKSLLTFFKLEKVLYELLYEINSRPDWIEIPLQGIKQCLHNLGKV